MASRNISLTDQHDDLIEAKIQAGEYANASEVVREGLRLIQERDRELAARVNALESRVAVGLEQAARGDLSVVPPTRLVSVFVDGLRSASPTAGGEPSLGAQTSNWIRARRHSFL